MNPELFTTVARFKLLMRSELQIEVDIQRLASDRGYARPVLAQAEASSKEELIALSLKLAVLLGLVPVDAGAGRGSGGKAAKVDPPRYLMGARS